eukprot:CAMPEP_0202686048 /NCGR_PEP_ID=MMETSP1385-20130828/1840_1 /ASSEMBLY_ACC=CAM_ASM_000861 /TAXON_ID=933848 /ORGANISM="Elphidium margaritaceum" /LENGTH=665 /DNA_ID=CAMNT_0049340547 /DNA_START=54 /DNA_END=2051 /DNA_ORIENTATION=+
MFKPNREFQAGLNADETRRRRQDNSLSLRRKDRENKLQQKRQRILERSSTSNTAVAANGNVNNSSSSQLANNDGSGAASLKERSRGKPEVTLSDLPKLVDGIYHSSLAAQYECVKGVRILLSQPNHPPIKQVIDSGVVPRFIQLSRECSHPELQYESLWALLNIASGAAECTAHIIRNNAHNVFIDLLRSSPFYEIREQSMWALGNIAGDGRELKDLLLQNGILGNALFICQCDFDAQYVTNFNHTQFVDHVPVVQFAALLTTTSWALSNLCRSSPPPTQQHLELIIQCIVALMKQAMHLKMSVIASVGQDTSSMDFANKLGAQHKLNNDVDEIFGNLAWGASYLTGFDYGDYDGTELLVRRLGEEGLISSFVNLMDYGNPNVRHSCNRVIGNILTGSDTHTKLCLNMGILRKYHAVLTREDSNTRERKEICWALSNITAGPTDDKLLLLKHGLYPVLIELLKTAIYDVGREALWALSNATTNHDKRVIAPLVDFGIVEALMAFLNRMNATTHAQRVSQSKTLLVALECIENILIVGQQHLVQHERNAFGKRFEECGCCDFLEALQTDEQIGDDVYEKSVDIIKKYFEGEEQEQAHSQQYLDGGAQAHSSTHLDYGLNTQANQNQNQAPDDDDDDLQNNNNQTQTNHANGNFDFGVNGNTGSFGF